MIFSAISLSHSKILSTGNPAVITEQCVFPVNSVTLNTLFSWPNMPEEHQTKDIWIFWHMFSREGCLLGTESSIGELTSEAVLQPVVCPLSVMRDNQKIYAYVPLWRCWAVCGQQSTLCLLSHLIKDCLVLHHLCVTGVPAKSASLFAQFPHCLALGKASAVQQLIHEC